MEEFFMHTPIEWVSVTLLIATTLVSLYHHGHFGVKPRWSEDNLRFTEVLLFAATCTVGYHAPDYAWYLVAVNGMARVLVVALAVSFTFGLGCLTALLIRGIIYLFKRLLLAA
ncbi:MAG: hypothetical protein KGI41_00975 [Patescibacteria group bacterium]|nr:hypothetical protein [Patescibacteria group bacterium]MDE1965802.1 hypothetical protein [Patescibacteria group bacterium]